MKTSLLLLALCLAAVANTNAEVKLGTEILAASGCQQLRGKRVALITNQTGVNRRGQSTIDLLRRAPGVQLVALLAPEHGLRGDLGAGQEFPDAIDPRTGLKVFSLYGPGPTRRPTAAMLAGIDVVVYDIQDIGVRSYTYISTMGLAMGACGAAGVEFLVLDRPNPLGGRRVEGPMVDKGFRSFVSQWDVPYVYGLTSGELARMINGENWATNRCKLTVIPLQGWRRSMVWRDTGLPWIPTSPNVQRPETALFLVATGVLGEIGGVSVGMGTATPFRFVAAPWLPAEKFCRQLGKNRLPGMAFQPAQFTPERGMFKGQRVSGARLELTDSANAPLVAVNFYALEAVRTVGGKDLFAEAVKRGKSFSLFEKVCGTDAIRRALQAGRPAADIVATWKPGEASFRQRRTRYLLY